MDSPESKETRKKKNVMKVALMASTQIAFPGMALANLRLRKRLARNGSSISVLCGLSVRLESLKYSLKFTYEWITGREVPIPKGSKMAT